MVIAGIVLLLLLQNLPNTTKTTKNRFFFRFVLLANRWNGNPNMAQRKYFFFVQMLNENEKKRENVIKNA